jgi:cold shock CspA family protein
VDRHRGPRTGRALRSVDWRHGSDVFVHHSNLAATITQGQRVAFAVRDGRKGLEAYDVVAV